MKLKGGKIYSKDFSLERRDIYIVDGKISFNGDDTDIINIDGFIAIPGNIDLLTNKELSLDNKPEERFDNSNTNLYEGKDADLIIIDRSFNIKAIIKNGDIIYTENIIENDINSPVTTSQKEKFIKLRNEMLNSATDKWTLEQMATKVGYSLSRFCYLYKKIFHISPMSDLSIMKVELSKNYLLNSDISIGQIAAISGFSSDSHYSYAFKKTTGITPTEYRINNKIAK